MESTIKLSEPFDLQNELRRVKILTEALTACVSDDKELTYEYLHQLSILPKEKQFLLVRFSGIPHHDYEKEFKGFTDIMKFLVISIRRIEEYLDKEAIKKKQEKGA